MKYEQVLIGIIAVLTGAHAANLVIARPAFDMRVATIATQLCQANEGPRTVQKRWSGFDIRCRNGALFDGITITLEEVKK